MPAPELYGPPRTDFGPAPPGYIAGLGRGVSGFSTQGDLGVPTDDHSIPSLGIKPPPGFVTETKDYSESAYSKFGGYQEKLFSGGKLSKEDQEADAMYERIERAAEERRLKKQAKKQAAGPGGASKTSTEAVDLSKTAQIQAEFRGLKRKLAEVTPEEWSAVPEAKDLSHRNKMLRRQQDEASKRFTPATDSVLTMGLDTGYSATLDTNGSSSSSGSMAPPSSDLTQLGRTRDKVLSLNLDKVADSVSGQSTVNSKSYLSGMATQRVHSSNDISDIKQARNVYKSAIESNPQLAPAWIGAVRLENEVGQIAAARKLALKGCTACPTSEDMWMEAASVHSPKQAQTILAKAVQRIPTSVTLWMEACSLERNVELKKEVLRRALEMVPTSVGLWKAAISLEEPAGALVMLNCAVGLIPHNVDMWLALAHLETYEKARKVLNRARRALPKEPSIWITAAQLEEAHGNVQNVAVVMQKGIDTLTSYSVVIGREEWLTEAENAEKAGSVATCTAIVACTVGVDVDAQDRRSTWLTDSRTCLKRGAVVTARAILSHLTGVFSDDEEAWLESVALERGHGTKQQLEAALRQAVAAAPQSEILWLMWAKERWLNGDVDGARKILDEAFIQNPVNEDVWLAAAKLERENKYFDRARGLLAKARVQVNSARVWMKAAMLERQLQCYEKELSLLETATRTSNFGYDYKLWLMLAQHHIRNENLSHARATFKKALKLCPKAVELWTCYAQMESKRGFFPKARVILENARFKLPKADVIWLEALRTERLAGNVPAAEALQAKAFDACPLSGRLWAHKIVHATRHKRKTLSRDAVTKCVDDPYVRVAAAQVLWDRGKVQSARPWFDRAILAQPDWGDAWIYYYACELALGTPAKAAAVLKRCADAEPLYGELWTRVSKSTQPEFSNLTPAEICALAAKTFVDAKNPLKPTYL